MGSMISAVRFIQEYECTVDSSGHQVVVGASGSLGKGLTLSEAVKDLQGALTSSDKALLTRVQIVIPSEGEVEIAEVLSEAQEALSYAAFKLSSYEDEDSSSRIREAADNVRDVYLAWGGE